MASSTEYRAKSLSKVDRAPIAIGLSMSQERVPHRAAMAAPTAAAASGSDGAPGGCAGDCSHAAQQGALVAHAVHDASEDSQLPPSPSLP